MNRFLNPREGNATTHNKNIAQNCRCYIVAIPFSRYDVFHLTGHADIRSGQPCFLMENNQGFKQEVSAEEIAEAFQGNWPRLLFIIEMTDVLIEMTDVLRNLQFHRAIQ
jgi:hypothetical protein